MTTPNTTKTAFVVGAMLIMLSLSYPCGVKAAGEFYCEDYARTAVEQYQELISLQCPYDRNNPIWHPKVEYHRSWCMGWKVTEAMCEEGTAERARALALCKGQHFSQPEHQRCEEYAKRSVNQNISNLGNGCGFSGPEWSSDKSYHYDWCMKNSVSQSELNTHLSKRDVALEKCLPYLSMEKNDKTFVVYTSDEEGRFASYANGFKDEFKDTWKLTQDDRGKCSALGHDHMNGADSADLAFLVGHGSPSSITLNSGEDGCWLPGKAWGSYSSSDRTGDLEYIVFMSCKVLSVDIDGKWRGRWRRYTSDIHGKRPFSGLHMALGFKTNHNGTAVSGYWEADEFAENLKDGLPVRLAWYMAVDDYRWMQSSQVNQVAVFYIRPHRDETIDEHDGRDYKYGDPEYLLDAYYATNYTVIEDFEGGYNTPPPDDPRYW